MTNKHYLGLLQILAFQIIVVAGDEAKSIAHGIVNRRSAACREQGLLGSDLDAGPQVLNGTGARVPADLQPLCSMPCRQDFPCTQQLQWAQELHCLTVELSTRDTLMHRPGAIASPSKALEGL